jgi:hypothetical protein
LQQSSISRLCQLLSATELGDSLKTSKYQNENIAPTQGEKKKERKKKRESMMPTQQKVQTTTTTSKQQLFVRRGVLQSLHFHAVPLDSSMHELISSNIVTISGVISVQLHMHTSTIHIRARKHVTPEQCASVLYGVYQWTQLAFVYRNVHNGQECEANIVQSGDDIIIDYEGNGDECESKKDDTEYLPETYGHSPTATSDGHAVVRRRTNQRDDGGGLFSSIANTIASSLFW